MAQAPSDIRHQIFDLPEILELILLLLPLKDLLLDQRVCSHWQSMIKGSHRLQEALFFKPEEPKVEHNDKVVQREINPLLLKHFRPWFMCKKLERDIHAGLTGFQNLSWIKKPVNALPAFLRGEASWRRMLLTQPALTTFEHVSTWSGRGPRPMRVGSIEVPQGVRMGLAYDRIQHTYRRDPTARQFYALVSGVFHRDETTRERTSKGKFRAARPSVTNEDTESLARQSDDSVRLFGGKATYSVVVNGHSGCGYMPGPHGWATDLRSEGFEDVKIEMKAIEQPRGWLSHRVNGFQMTWEDMQQRRW